MENLLIHLGVICGHLQVKVSAPYPICKVVESSCWIAVLISSVSMLRSCYQIQ